MTNMKPIPCHRCGKVLAVGVADLISKLQTGGAVAGKAQYACGETAADCGAWLTPGARAASAAEGSDRTFIDACKRQLNEALAAEGYVRLYHVPVPVKLGSPEEAAMRALSAERNAAQSSKGKVKGTAMRPDCMFVLLPSGEWADRVTVAAAEQAAAAKSAPTGAIPAPPPPPGKASAAIPAPPPPPARKVHVATEDKGVVEVLATDARAMLADGRAYAVLVNGAWADTL